MIQYRFDLVSHALELESVFQDMNMEYILVDVYKHNHMLCYVILGN